MFYHLGETLVYSTIHYAVVLYGQGLLTYDVRGTNFNVAYETPEMRHVCSGQAGNIFMTFFDPCLMTNDTQNTIDYLSGEGTDVDPHFPFQTDNMLAECSVTANSKVSKLSVLFLLGVNVQEKLEIATND